MSQEGIEKRPAGFLPLGVFFFFGAVMATYAAVTLLKPGTFLDRAWMLNPTAYAQLRPLSPIIAIPFVVLALLLFMAGVGWFGRRRWSWILGLFILAVNLAGDGIHLAMGDRKSLVGVAIAGFLLTYLTRPVIRDFFH